MIVCLPAHIMQTYIYMNFAYVHAVVNDNINMYLYDQTAVFYMCSLEYFVLGNIGVLVCNKVLPLYNIGYNLTVCRIYICTDTRI